VSASDRGTASDYSKGLALQRRDFATSHALLAAVALAGAGLLVAAELSPLYTVVVGALETPRRSVSGGSSHAYALVVVALAAAAMALGALRGARGAAAALGALGAVVLLFALAIDAPKTRRSATLPEAVAFADARARAGSGLALEVAGGAALLVAGGLMLALGAPSPPRRRVSGSKRVV
jgi:hypothetical protein